MVNQVPFAVLRSISDGDGGAIDYQTFAEKAAMVSIEIILEFIKNGLEFNDLSLNLHEDKEDIITTEYEDKFVAKGNVIYFVEVKNNGK